MATLTFNYTQGQQIICGVRDFMGADPDYS